VNWVKFRRYNALTGTLPTELGFVPEVTLQILYLTNNAITGPSPEELGFVPSSLC
jgi:hypothetical protein